VFGAVDLGAAGYGGALEDGGVILSSSAVRVKEREKRRMHLVGGGMAGVVESNRGLVVRASMRLVIILLMA
jgi:hypothetical protein